MYVDVLAVKSSSGKSAGHSASASQKDRSSRPGAWQSRASANGEQYGYYDRIDSTASCEYALLNECTYHIHKRQMCKVHA
jgi:hypothetical protein